MQIHFTLNVDDRIASFLKRVFTRRKLMVAIAVAFAASAVVYAASVPNTFSAGQTVSASQMNANFNALTTAVTTLEGKTTNWDAAYGWGDHNNAGYLTTYTETDPQVGANTTNYVPKWNGTALVSSSISEDSTGKVAIGGDISVWGTAGLYKAVSGSGYAAGGVYFVAAGFSNSGFGEVLRHSFVGNGSQQIKVDLLASMGNNYDGGGLSQISGVSTLTFSNKSSTTTLSIGSTVCTFRWTLVSGYTYKLEGMITGGGGTAAEIAGLAIIKGGNGQ